MSLPHEIAARKVHPSANEFMPVTRQAVRKKNRTLYGWTFKARKPDTASEYFGWVTCGNEVAGDLVRVRVIADVNMKAYVDNMGRRGLPQAVEPEDTTVIHLTKENDR